MIFIFLHSLEIQGNVLSYKAEAIINCESYIKHKNETLNVACTFTNHRANYNKYKTKNVEIPVILRKFWCCLPFCLFKKL